MSFDEFRGMDWLIYMRAQGKQLKIPLLEMLSHLQRDPRPGIPQEPEEMFTSKRDKLKGAGDDTYRPHKVTAKFSIERLRSQVCNCPPISRPAIWLGLNSGWG